MAFFTNKLWANTIFLALVCVNICFAQQNSTLRAVPLVRSDDVCPRQGVLDAKKNSVKAEVHQLLESTVLPSLNHSAGPYGHGCGGRGWTRIVHLDMTDPTQQCPPGLRLISAPVRGCHQTAACSSAFFPVSRSYSQVCGRVNAYQYGTTDAFHVSIISSRARSIEQEYFGGVSLTHGRVGSRQHIWSFAAAISERTTDSYYDRNRFSQKCSCIHPTQTWPYTTPSFVGNDYFCDTGNLGPGWSYSTYYTNNPMWDGEGCGPTSGCCQFNNPPWFSKALPQATSDQIELRICGSSHERIIVYLAEIFVN